MIGQIVVPTLPIPIQCVDEESPEMPYLKAVASEAPAAWKDFAARPLAAYLPTFMGIVVFTRQFHRLTRVALTFHDKKKLMASDLMMKPLKKVLNHEINHYLQHRHLITKIGVFKGTEAFSQLVTIGTYLTNPLENNSRQAEKEPELAAAAVPSIMDALIEEYHLVP
jgi:hypothetical protein